MKFRIWDTPGENRHFRINYMFFEKVDSFIIVLDGTLQDNEDLKRNLFELIEEIKQRKADSPIFINVNKCDLDMKIQMDEVKSFAEQNNYPLFTTTATDQRSVETMFAKIAEILSQNPKFRVEKENKPSNDEPNKKCTIA